VYVLEEFLDCSFRILTGFIEPHFFAGFSGGGKAVVPGLAGLETVMANHRAMFLDEPGSRWGVRDGNPLWEDLRDAALLAEPSFLMNVTLNRDKAITAVFCGGIEEAHKAGCDYVRDQAMVAVDEPFDIVVTSNSGYPLDLNLYQSVKGMSAASQIVKDGGSIVLAAECWDGIPSHGLFGSLLREAGSLSELLAEVRRPDCRIQDMWQVLVHAQIREKAEVYVYTDGLSDQDIRDAKLQRCTDIAATVVDLARRYGPGARVCVLPEGPQTIPYLKPCATKQPDG
jgi:nickel-dependent lactate racemase